MIQISDIESRLGRHFDQTEQQRVWLLIQDVTATVEGILGTSFSATGSVTGETPVPRNRFLILEKWPVTSITSVQDDDGTDLDWSATSLRDGVIRLDTAPLNGVNVDYHYGWADTPAAVVAVVAQVTGRAFGTPADRAGVTSETTGPYNFQIGAAAGAGPMGLLTAERETLRQQRRRIPYAARGTVELVDWLA